MRRPQASASMRLTAAACAAFVVSMVGMAYAAVPLYRLFCQVTGFGGTTMRADAAPGAVADRTIEVRFDANVASDLPWRFRPVQRTVRVRLGEQVTVHYEAENLSQAATAGTATFNVSPPVTGAYFNKIDCFCFNEQVLAPGQRAEMPVVFFVDPALVDDADAAGVPSITLSYTFFAVQQPAKPLAGSAGAESRL